MSIIDDLQFAQLTRRAVRVTGPSRQLGLVAIYRVDLDQHTVTFGKPRPFDDRLRVTVKLGDIDQVEITALDLGDERVR
jgi:hypothetical protein